MKFKKGEIVFCIDETVFGDLHLTKRKKYQILETGKGSKSGKFRIKGDSARLVWISDLYFCKINQPAIEDITILDEIEDPKKDCIEVRVSFADGSEGCFAAITPEYLTNILVSSNSFFIGKHALIISEISYEFLVKHVEELDKKNELFSLLNYIS